MNGWIRSSSTRSTFSPTISKVKVTICSRSPSASPSSCFSSRSRRRSSSSSNWCPTRCSSTTSWIAPTINLNCFAVRTSLVHSRCFRLAPCTKVREPESSFVLLQSEGRDFTWPCNPTITEHRSNLQFLTQDFKVLNFVGSLTTIRQYKCSVLEMMIRFMEAISPVCTGLPDKLSTDDQGPSRS